MSTLEKKEIALIQILQLIENNINPEQFYWSILYLYVNGCRDDNISVTELEEEIRIMKGGYKLNWKELKTLLSKFEQIITCPIVGCKTNNEIDYIKSIFSEDKYKDTFIMSEIGLYVDDGSMWGFYSKDKQLEKTICDAIGPFPVSIY